MLKFVSTCCGHTILGAGYEPLLSAVNVRFIRRPWGSCLEEAHWHGPHLEHVVHLALGAHCVIKPPYLLSACLATLVCGLLRLLESGPATCSLSLVSSWRRHPEKHITNPPLSLPPEKLQNTFPSWVCGTLGRHRHFSHVNTVQQGSYTIPSWSSIV